MPIIAVLEYRLPYGRQIDQGLEVSEEIAAIAEKLGPNRRLAYEMLSNGAISWTIENLEKEEDEDIQLVFNPTHEKGLAGLEKMLKRWNSKMTGSSNVPTAEPL